MKLDVWQKSILLLRITNESSPEKSIPYKLKTQVLDSAQSVSSNIAEGYCRRHLNEYIQFCYVALASLGETLTRSIGLKELSILTEEQFKRIDEIHYEIENKLLSLVKSLESRRDSGDWEDRISDSVQSDYISHKLESED